MPTVLSSRKLSTAQAQLLLNAGISYVEYDAIKIEFLSVAIPSEIENAIVTSQNTVKALLEKDIKIKNCFCVGEKTKALLEKNGVSVLETTAYGHELAHLIVKKYAYKEFNFFCGNKRREELPSILGKHGIVFEETQVYKTHLNPRAFKQQFDGIMFFSPSQVHSFNQKNNLKNQNAFCIGKTTAAEAEKHTKNTIIATKPTVENVIVQVVKKLIN